MRLPAAKIDDDNNIEKAGDLLVFYGGAPPIYGIQPLYFKYPELVRRSLLPPPEFSDSSDPRTLKQRARKQQAPIVRTGGRIRRIMNNDHPPAWRVMSFFPLAGIAAFLYFDFHPDWFLIPGGSAPQGLWRAVDYDRGTIPERGSWVVVCPPLSAEEHRQLFVEEPPVNNACESQLSLKQIAAIPGDRVIVEFPYVVTPLRTAEAIDVDNRGSSLPRPSNGTYSVSDGTYWVLTQNQRSVDSRYYGPVSTNRILKIALPIWTSP